MLVQNQRQKSTNYEDEVTTILTNASSYQKAAIHTEYMECEHGDGLSSIGDYTHSNNRRNNSGSSSFCSKGSSKKSKKIAARSSSHLSMSKTNTDTKMDSTRSQDNSGGFYSSGKDANDDTSVSTSSLGYRWITL